MAGNFISCRRAAHLHLFFVSFVLCLCTVSYHVIRSSHRFNPRVTIRISPLINRAMWGNRIRTTFVVLS